MKLAFSTLFATTMLLGTAAYADGFDKCTDEPKDKWQTADAVSAKAKELGYEVKEIKTEGTCYEIYGVGQDGKLMELFFNPVSAELMHSEAKS
jgi:hypothetical protein